MHLQASDERAPFEPPGLFVAEILIPFISPAISLPPFSLYELWKTRQHNDDVLRKLFVIIS